MSKRVDLLNGGIASSLTKLALPIMATSLIQMAYNLTDMIWIGRMGSNQVAAIGAASMYVWLSQAFAVLCRMGGQVKLGHSMGAGDNKTAVSYAQNAIQMGAIFSLLYGAVSLIFANPLIGFFNLNSRDVIADAKIYLCITCGAVIFSTLNQILTGLITTSGNSKTPFKVTTVGLVINIIADPILIFGIGPIKAYGVGGAAAATVFAQAVVTLLFFLYMKRDKLIFSHLRYFAKPNLRRIGDIVKIGLPSAVQSAMMTLISMVIARLIASWGDAAVAVQKVGSQIESISWMTADGFAVAVNSFVAQNHGAGNHHRAERGIKVSLVITTIWGVIATALLFFLARPIFAVFIPDASIIPLGVDYLTVLSFSQLFMCWEIVGTGALSGFGKSLPPSVINIIFTFMRIPFASILSATALKLNGIWWSISISSMFKGVLILLMLFIFMYRNRDRSAEAQV